MLIKLGHLQKFQNLQFINLRGQCKKIYSQKHTKFNTFKYVKTSPSLDYFLEQKLLPLFLFYTFRILCQMIDSLPRIICIQFLMIILHSLLFVLSFSPNRFFMIQSLSVLHFIHRLLETLFNLQSLFLKLYIVLLFQSFLTFDKPLATDFVPVDQATNLILNEKNFGIVFGHKIVRVGCN